MSFFNNKEDVLHIELTPLGRQKLSEGKLMPAYYSFLDEDVLYDLGAANSSELNHQVKDRILVETPYLKPQTNFTDLEAKIVEKTPDLVSDTFKYNLNTMGTSKNVDDFAPTWEIVFLKNEIVSSTRNLSSSYGFHQVPQINLDIEYTISAGNINTDLPDLGTFGSPNLAPDEVFPDGTYLKIEEEEILARILERNGFLHGKSIQVEAFKFDSPTSDRLIPLTFLKRQSLIENDILMDEEQLPLNPERTPENVEYYFDFRVDREIPILEICKGIGKLNSQNPISDFEIVCPDIRKRNPTDIYASNITDQDIEDCTTKEDCD